MRNNRHKFFGRKINMIQRTKYVCVCANNATKIQFLCEKIAL